jgi:hypothetical protein
MHLIKREEELEELQIPLCQRPELVEVGRHAERGRAGAEYAIPLQAVNFATH